MLILDFTCRHQSFDRDPSVEGDGLLAGGGVLLYFTLDLEKDKLKQLQKLFLMLFCFSFLMEKTIVF